MINEFIRVVDPAEAIVTHDSGSPREQLLPFYRATRPRSYLGWGKSHQLGTGLGLTIGAKVAAPDKFCVNFMGDAAFGMTGLDFETAVRCGVPICTIVLNNSAMAIEIPHMKLSHERYRSRDLGGSYANLARDLGGWSERVEDPAQVADAIVRARRQTEDGRACLLEFVTSQETAFSQARGVMSEEDAFEAEELERAAEWRMRKVDADPSDAASRDAAALLEKLARDVRALRGAAVFREYMAICNWLGESDGIADFMDMAKDYRARIGVDRMPAMGRRIYGR